MRAHVLPALRDALAAWRRDRAILAPLAGLAIFLPQLAVLLLVPPLPRPPVDAAGDAAAAAAWTAQVAEWGGTYAPWYLLSFLLGLFGALAVMSLYLAAPRPTLGAALRGAGTLLLRYLLATWLTGMAAFAILLPGAWSRPLMAILVAPAFWWLGRTMLAGVVIVAERPVGAVAAIGRSWTLTRRRGWPRAALSAAARLVAQLVGAAALSAGAATGLVAVGAALAALAATASALVLALAQVALYRAATTGT